MADIATIWDPAVGRGDWALPGDTFTFARGAGGAPIVGPAGAALAFDHAGALPGAGLVSGADIQTAVLISIFTDAVANDDDQLPDASDDRRGWWGDRTIGSRLWLRLRAKQTPQTLLLVKADIEAALAWLIEDGVAAAVDVATEWRARGALGGAITIRRRDGTSVAVDFEWAWKDL